MAKTYRKSHATRLINSLSRTLTRFGLGPPYLHILTVHGRKTGRRYSTPVDVLELDGQRWLVAPYGPVSWVANARAAGEVTLSRGGRSHQFEVEEAALTAAVPVLRNYITEIRVTRPYSTLARRQPTRNLRQNCRGTQSSGSSRADRLGSGVLRQTHRTSQLTLVRSDLGPACGRPLLPVALRRAA